MKTFIFVSLKNLQKFLVFFNLSQVFSWTFFSIIYQVSYVKILIYVF